MIISDVPSVWASNNKPMTREERLSIALLRVAGCECELPLLREGPRCKLCGTRVELEQPTQEKIHARRVRQHQTYKRLMSKNLVLAESLREFMGEDFPACFDNCGCPENPVFDNEKNL